MISIKNLLAVTALMTGGAFISCGNSQKNSQQIEESEAAIVQAPAFNADSAYAYIAAQVQFGPRVPNTEAHRRCGDYLAAQLEKFGAKVYNQHADLVAYNGTILKSRNIIGAYQPENKKRVMLCAHWDSRPYADQDEKSNHQKPIDGANDGASGVGVLLEIARQIQQQAPQIGIDLIFFDSEDYGTPDFYEGTYKPDTWCLGSQYWGRIPHVPDYKARFGILLDMVGGENSVFLKEGYSEEFAPDINKKVWKAAKKAGYGKTFIDERGDTITDDHLFINRLARIKTIDIIPNDPETGFPPTWHTIHDNMDHIDKNTLKAVGQTVLEVIYNEK